MNRRFAVAASLLVLGALPARAQAPAPPAMLVPPEIRPGEVEPDPGISVPDRIVPAPAPLRPRATRDEAAVPRGGGDPGILVPAPEAKPAPSRQQAPPASQ